MMLVSLLLVLLATATYAADADDSAPPSIALIGLGAMGCAAARALAEKPNVSLSVWNRTPGRCEGLPAGVRRAAAVRQAVTGADVVLVMLTSVQNVLDVLGFGVSFVVFFFFCLFVFFLLFVCLFVVCFRVRFRKAFLFLNHNHNHNQMSNQVKMECTTPFVQQAATQLL